MRILGYHGLIQEDHSRWVEILMHESVHMVVVKTESPVRKNVLDSQNTM